MGHCWGLQSGSNHMACNVLQISYTTVLVNWNWHINDLHMALRDCMYKIPCEHSYPLEFKIASLVAPVQCTCPRNQATQLKCPDQKVGLISSSIWHYIKTLYTFQFRVHCMGGNCYIFRRVSNLVHCDYKYYVLFACQVTYSSLCSSVIDFAKPTFLNPRAHTYTHTQTRVRKKGE